MQLPPTQSAGGVVHLFTVIEQDFLGSYSCTINSTMTGALTTSERVLGNMQCVLCEPC